MCFFQSRWTNWAPKLFHFPCGTVHKLAVWSSKDNYIFLYRNCGIIIYLETRNCKIMHFFNKQICLFYNTWININLLKEALMFLLLLIIMKLYISAYCTYIDHWILMIPSVLHQRKYCKTTDSLVKSWPGYLLTYIMRSTTNWKKQNQHKEKKTSIKQNDTW